nr:hypothetical protein [Salinispora pacifica]
MLLAGVMLVPNSPAHAGSDYTTDASEWLMIQLLNLESGTENGGIYANKPGYHNTRAGNHPNNYSVLDQEDKGGPSDKAAAYDWTFLEAQDFMTASNPDFDAQPMQQFTTTAADYSAISRYSQRLLASGKDPDDPRMDGWREFYGQADNDSGVEGYNFRYDYEISSDPSHLWHIHLSEDRDKVTSMANKEALLSVLRGETVEQWLNKGGDRSYYNGSQDHHYERGADNTLVHWWYTDKWNQAILPGTITSDPVAYYANGQDHVYGRNASGGLQHWWYAGGQWNTANLGGAITGAPTAFYANGQDHAFARTTEGTLYHWWYVSGSGWQKADLGGAITGSPTGYAGGNQQHVYARTTAGTLYHWWYVPGSGWQKADLGGAITNSPSGYRADNGQDHVYARTTAGTLYHWWYVPGTGWKTANLGGAITDSPTAYYAGGQDHVYARTTAGTLYHWWYVPGSGWNTSDLGGAITGSPSGYRAETNQQDHAYAKTTNGTLQHWWYVPGTGWKTANLGGNL